MLAIAGALVTLRATTFVAEVSPPQARAHIDRADVPCLRSRGPWCVHDDGDASQADDCAGDVPSIWPEAIKGYAPEE